MAPPRIIVFTVMPAELEIGIHRYDESGSYTVELKFAPAESDVEMRLARRATQIDLDALRALEATPHEYGRRLAELLFADPEVLAAFARARASRDEAAGVLRVRLLVGPTGPELHLLRWELLHDPVSHTPLTTSESLLFSRYLGSGDLRPIRPRSEALQSALVVVANPTDLDQWAPGGDRLAPLDVPGELRRAKTALNGVRITAVTSPGLTLARLLDALHAGCDLLYLACHGAYMGGEPRLWLENEEGGSAVVSGTELAERIGELAQRPVLVVLASCESAGKGSGDALAALGPRLAEAGVPAVVAMQGQVSMETAGRFVETFFRQLQADGQIDRAAAAARGAIREQPDSWMPALFMRLKSGRLWQGRGFAENRPRFEKWPALLRGIQRGGYTPILGPGLTEPLLGSAREMARRWARDYQFPLSRNSQDELPQVAQYLAIDQGIFFPRDELLLAIRDDLLARHRDLVAARISSGPVEQATLEEIIRIVGAEQRAAEPTEPHRVLAGLPFPLYLNANPDSLLADALAEAGRPPRVEVCRWNAPFTGDGGAPGTVQPDRKQPLVYHLFGRVEEPDLLTITQDDYFNYLIGISRDTSLIPPAVRSALASTALLFLGFQMEDWKFRVLFHSLMNQEGRKRGQTHPHVAVQLDPDTSSLIDPERARQYLESYFDDADISIYWGSARDFVAELQQRTGGGNG